ncbi:unnamed protein product [Candidula unifasciata]|uniref:t-SNARE coiled-coil homology domain-containing protein n=1 Tax=Candidula unifasciata TaxID=100452 RepID=A0A8S3ZYZ7_9EUPU|nr:unnamed protein product [Candidula unifasciata]
MTSYGKGNFDGYTPYQGDSRSEGERGSDFAKLSRDISSNVQKITQNVTQIQKLVNQIGTLQDSDDMRQRIHQTTHYTKQLANETSQYLKSLAHLPVPSSQSEQRQWKMQKERLTDEFTNALKNFQTVQRAAAEKEKESVQRTIAHSGLDRSPFDSGSHDDGMSAPGYSQTRQVLQMEQDVDLELLREREDAIKKLESDIVDVNQIFKDLGMLVHEQGEVLDSIEANIDNAQMSVEEGTKQLSKARAYQAKSRRKCLILIVIVCFIILIVALIIYLSVK